MDGRGDGSVLNDVTRFLAVVLYSFRYSNFTQCGLASLSLTRPRLFLATLSPFLVSCAM